MVAKDFLIKFCLLLTIFVTDLDLTNAFDMIVFWCQTSESFYILHAGSYTTFCDILVENAHGC